MSRGQDKRRLFFAPAFLLFAWTAIPAFGQDAPAIWASLRQPAFDPEKSATVSNVAFARDRIRITLVEGTIHFTQPVNGVVFGAAFRGRGRIEVQPPNALEAQQLRLLADQDSLAMEFTEAVFTFTDNTFDELAAQLRWAPAADASLADLYTRRQREREDAGAELVPRLFKGLLSRDRKRTTLFATDLKTNEKGWIYARLDALQPEEITVGRWAEWGGSRNFETWLSFPAGGRSASEAYHEPLAREDVRIRSYHIEATVTDAAELRATTQLGIEALAEGERVLVFELDANLRLEAVKLAQGGAVPFFQPQDPKERRQSYGDYVAVVLPEPTRAGQGQTLEFHYAGKRIIRKEGTGNFFCQSYGWYPTRPTSFAVRADFELLFRSPKKYTLVATGNKTSETTDGDWTISTWKSDVPLAVAGFAFGDFKVFSEKSGATQIEVYANSEPDAFMKTIRAYLEGAVPGFDPTGIPEIGTLSPAAMVKTMSAEVGNTLRLFERFFGPYPYKHIAMTNIPYAYGQGWPGLIFLSALSFLDSTQRQVLGLTEQILLSDFFRAHEVSHQWWGHRVGWKSYHDQWLSEGFAEFSGNLYVQFRQNEKEYVSRLRQEKRELFSGDQRRRSYASLGPVWMGTRLASADAPAGYDIVVYRKGGYVLHMLRMMLYDPRSPQPEQRFIAMMQEFCERFQNQAASTEDFKAVAEKHMLPVMDLDGNKRLDWFFRQYVYGTGLAQYQFRYQVQEAGGKWKVTGSVARSGVPDSWKDILPLYLHTGGRAVRLGWIQATEKESPFELLLPTRPEKLSLNANEDILVEIKQ